MSQSLSKEKMFQALMDITQEINSIHDINELLRRVMDIAMQTLKADRGFIILKAAADEKSFNVAIARNVSQKDLADLTSYSSSVIETVLGNGKSILSYDAQADERFRGAGSVILNKISSIAAVPLHLKSRVIGAIYIDASGGIGRFTEDSVSFLTAFANQAAIAIENARLFETIHEENQTLRRQVEEKYQFDEIIGHSRPMMRVFDLVQKVAKTSATVLVEGPSGTGKELIARALHYNGPRKKEPFVAVFCSALSASILESELFGHTKGAFTGAHNDKKGLLESAHGGTVFLDEVSEISPDIQTKLLRFLQEGEIKRVGESKTRIVDVRVIAATNKILQDEVNEGRFREDLFYRLNVIKIHVPPLRERGEDIPLLTEHFLAKYKKRIGSSVSGFSRAAMETLLQYNWPGNVRELENTIERAVILATSDQIERDDLQLVVMHDQTPFRSDMTLKDVEKAFVLRTLDEYDKNISKTAAALEVSRRWLHYRLKEWGYET